MQITLLQAVFCLEKEKNLFFTGKNVFLSYIKYWKRRRRPPGSAMTPEESPDSIEQGVRLMADTAKQICRKESATESKPPGFTG